MAERPTTGTRRCTVNPVIGREIEGTEATPELLNQLAPQALILAVGSLLTNGRFDQIFNTYSSPVYPVADTIDTYIFRETFTTGIMNFGYSTAIGVLKSVVGLFMIVTTNKIVTSAGEQGLL